VIDELADLERALQDFRDALTEYGGHTSWRCEHPPHFYLADEAAARKIVDRDDCYCGWRATARRLGIGEVE